MGLWSQIAARLGYRGRVTETPGRAVLLARALAVSATTLALSTGAHVIGGGHTSSPVLLGVLGVLLVGAAVPLARRPLRLTTLLAWVTAGQVTVHLVLSWLHPAAGTHVAIAGHHGLESATTVASTHTSASSGTSMLVAHVVGSVIAAALIVATDRSAAAARAHWGWVRSIVAGPVLATLTPAEPLPPHRSTPLGPRLIVEAVRRRGPPFALAA